MILSRKYISDLSLTVLGRAHIWLLYNLAVEIELCMQNINYHNSIVVANTLHDI